MDVLGQQISGPNDGFGVRETSSESLDVLGMRGCVVKLMLNLQQVALLYELREPILVLLDRVLG